MNYVDPSGFNPYGISSELHADSVRLITGGSLSTLMVRLENSYETEQRLFALVNTDWKAAGLFSCSDASETDEVNPVSYLVFQCSDPE